MRTCTIATLRILPLSPTAKEDTAISAGPAVNFNPMASIPVRVPHAIMLPRVAMKRPIKQHKLIHVLNLKVVLQISWQVIRNYFIPKLNIAIPSPPFDSIAIDCVTISGSFTPHLQQIIIQHIGLAS